MDMDEAEPLQNDLPISGDVSQHRAEEGCTHVYMRRGLPCVVDEQDAIAEQQNGAHLNPNYPEVEGRTSDVVLITWHLDTIMICVSVHGPDFDGPYVKIQHHPKSGKPRASYIPQSEYFRCRQSTLGVQQRTDVYGVDLAPNWLGFKSYADFTFAETAFQAGLSNPHIDDILHLQSNVWNKGGESQLSFKSHRDLLKIQRHHFDTGASKVRLLPTYTLVIHSIIHPLSSSRSTSLARI
jgi:hypothetical protein